MKYRWGSLFLVGMAACGEGAQGDLPPGGESELPLSMLEAEQARATCAALFRCDVRDPAVVGVRILAGDEAGCRSLLTRASSDDLKDLKLAVSDGTVLYDAKAARRCLAEYAGAAGCEIFTGSGEAPAACEAVFAGTIGVGSACQRPEECEGDSFCLASTTSTLSACPGTCTARVQLGAPCSAESACSQTGAQGRAVCYFDPAATTEPRSTCRDRRVGPAAAEGAPCGRNAETFTDTPCGAALWCDPSVGLCRARVADGAACTRGAHCANAQSTCHPAAAGANDTCGPVTVQRQANQACDQGSLVCDATANLQCVQPGVCMPVVPNNGAQGEACTNNFGSSCASGLYCQEGEVTNTCEPKVPLNGRCTTNDGCSEGSCDSGVCRRRDCRVY